MYLVTLWLSAWAQAATPIPVWTEGAERSVKLDVFSYAPGLHPWGTDWDATTLEQWSAVLVCHMEAGRREVCTFRGEEAWWGYVREGTTQVVFHQVPMKGAFELTWSPTGRLSAWDVTGDRDEFRRVASNAYLDLYHRQGVEFRPDAVRRIGEDLEQGLLLSFAAALELDMPRGGKLKEGTWKGGDAPWLSLRYSQGAASAQLKYQLAEGAPTTVAMQGRVAQAAPTGGSVSTYAVDATVLGEWEVDPATWRPVRAWVEAVYGSTSTQLVGHTRFLGLAEPFAEGMSAEPANFPQPKL